MRRSPSSFPTRRRQRRNQPDAASLYNSQVKLTRRDHLRQLAAATLATAVPRCVFAQTAGPASAQLPSLLDAAAAVGLAYGSASDNWFRNEPPAYRQLFLRQCALYAPILSWQDVAPTPDGENDQFDPNTAVALDAGLKITGSHLLWYMRTPPWLETLPRAQAEQAVTAHIARIAGFYRGRVFSWNVVNEAIEPPQDGPDGLRMNSPLVRALGTDFFASAFREARAADPNALLLYNDYDLDLDVPWQQARRDALFRLLDRLQRSGAPIDGVGLQSHLKHRQFSDFHEKQYSGFLHDIAARGLKIVITELDVDDIGLPSDTAARDQAVADVYARFLAVALNEAAVTALITWGICDAYSWHNHTQYFPEYTRTDHLPQRPLLFDANFQPKPSFYAVLHALEDAPKRTPRT
jgi:endo-1,4-beta-xylanase